MTDFFSNNSEIAFLSILLHHPELTNESSNVRVGMMSSTATQVTLSAILELTSQNLIPEKGMMIDFLNSVGKLSLIGGEKYLDYLYEQEYNLENFTKFRDLIIDSYRAREVISSTSEVPSLIAQGRDIDKVIYDLKSRLDSLNGRDIGNYTFRLSESLQEVWNELLARTANPGLVGTSTGFRSINLFTGGYPEGDLWIIGARPSQGKTSFICNSAINSSLENGVPLIFSIEMNKQTVVERIISILSGVPLSDIRLGTIDQEAINKIHEAIKILKQLPIFIDVNFTTDIAYSASIIKKYVKNFNVNSVWIDYVQLMSERGADQTAELGRITRALKLLAKELGIFIGITAQLNRLVEMRDDKRPILSDLRQSGNLEEDADLVAFLYRDEYYYSDSKNKGLMEFIVRKHRNGPVGMIPMKFEKETTVIKDV